MRGIYKFEGQRREAKAAAQLFGSGPILNEVLRAQEILAEKYGVAADVWSVTSYNELRREALGRGALESAASGRSGEDAVHRDGAGQARRGRLSRRPII